MSKHLIGIREGIHRNYISLSASRMNFYPGHFEIPEKIYFPWRRSMFCENNRTDKSHRITNRDTFLIELRQRFTTHLLRRFCTGTPLLEKFVNNESSCVSTIARHGYIERLERGDKINFEVYVSVFRCRSRYGRFCNER